MLPLIKTKMQDSQLQVQGYLIGSSLMVFCDRSWCIASRHGKLLFQNICTQKDAVEFAMLLDKIYSEYFCLWYEFPQMDIFKVCQWSVPDGQRWFKVIEELRATSTITINFVQYLFQKYREGKISCV